MYKLLQFKWYGKFTRHGEGQTDLNLVNCPAGLTVDRSTLEGSFSRIIITLTGALQFPNGYADSGLIKITHRFIRIRKVPFVHPLLRR